MSNGYTFHDMIHNEVKVYVDDMVAKSQEGESHVVILKKLFKRLRTYKLKLNLGKGIHKNVVRIYC